MVIENRGGVKSWWVIAEPQTMASVKMSQCHVIYTPYSQNKAYITFDSDGTQQAEHILPEASTQLDKSTGWETEMTM
jgi:hypothetical protein